MLAHRVHGRDRRAGGEQRLVDGNLVGEGQAACRGRQQRRAAAADQRHHEVVLSQARDRCEQPLGGGQSQLVRDGMRGFEHLDALAGNGIAVAGDNDAL
jgi:hypothetical protein